MKNFRVHLSISTVLVDGDCRCYTWNLLEPFFYFGVVALHAPITTATTFAFTFHIRPLVFFPPDITVGWNLSQLLSSAQLEDPQDLGSVVLFLCCSHLDLWTSSPCSAAMFLYTIPASHFYLSVYAVLCPPAVSCSNTKPKM